MLLSKIRPQPMTPHINFPVIPRLESSFTVFVGFAFGKIDPKLTDESLSRRPRQSRVRLRRLSTQNNEVRKAFQEPPAVREVESRKDNRKKRK